MEGLGGLCSSRPSCGLDWGVVGARGILRIPLPPGSDAVVPVLVTSLCFPGKGGDSWHTRCACTANPWGYAALPRVGDPPSEEAENLPFQAQLGSQTVSWP